MRCVFVAVSLFPGVSDLFEEDRNVLCDVDSEVMVAWGRGDGKVRQGDCE